MKNKAFNEFLISLLMLMMGFITLLFVESSYFFILVFACFGVSIVYAVSTVIIGIKQLRRREGKKYMNLAAVIFCGFIATAFALFVFGVVCEAIRYK